MRFIRSGIEILLLKIRQNSDSTFTDREIMTIYLFAGQCQKYFRIKDIYNFASEYISSRFPKLPSYRTFNLRLNRLNEAFRVLSERSISSFMPDDCDKSISLVDSLPVMTCVGDNRQGKVVRKKLIKICFLRLFPKSGDAENRSSTG